VTCRLGGFSSSVVAASTESSGGGYQWKCPLPQKTGSFATYTVDVGSSSGESVTLENVVFGDVLFCGGQSNMQFSVPGMFDAEEYSKEAGNYPMIRKSWIPLSHIFFLKFRGPSLTWLFLVACPRVPLSPVHTGHPLNIPQVFSASGRTATRRSHWSLRTTSSAQT